MVSMLWVLHALLLEVAHRRLQTGRNAEELADLEDRLHSLMMQVERLVEEVSTLKKEPRRVEESRRVEQPSNISHRNCDIVCWHYNEEGKVKQNCPQIL